jgi:hypothetical protein
MTVIWGFQVREIKLFSLARLSCHSHPSPLSIQIEWHGLYLIGLDSNGYEIYEEVDECSIVPESTLLTLTISYNLPQAGVILLESLGPKGQQFIQQTLLGDLKRFRERLVRDLRDERMESFRRSQIGRNSKKKSDTLSDWWIFFRNAILHVNFVYFHTVI